MTADATLIDELVQRRASVVAPSSGSLDPEVLWRSGRQRRRSRRLASAGVGAALTIALATGVVVVELGDTPSERTPATAGNPTASVPPSVPAAVFDPLDAVVASLRDPIRHLYIAPDAPGQAVVDSTRTAQDIGTADIKVAVLPAEMLPAGQTPAELAATIGDRLDDRKAVVIVIAGQKPGAAAGKETGFFTGTAESVLDNAMQAHAGRFTLANVQGTLDQAIASYVEALSQQDASAPPSGYFNYP